MPVVIDEVEAHVEDRPPVVEAAPDMSKPRPSIDPGQVIKAFAVVKERELRLRAD